MQVVLPVRRYGVKYPALYASDSNANANAFNCVQRGHQNSLEQLPHFLTVFVASSLKVSHLKAYLPSMKIPATVTNPSWQGTLKSLEQLPLFLTVFVALSLKVRVISSISLVFLPQKAVRA